MNGTSHATIGLGVGYIVAHTMHADTKTTVILLGAGVISALMPDLDIDGKLANKITLPFNPLKRLSFLIGCLIIGLAWFNNLGQSPWKGTIIGILLIFSGKLLTKRLMLTITGIGVFVFGITLAKLWIILLGIYIILASFLAHRSYTHTLVGAVYFSWVAYLAAIDVNIPELLPALTFGYISHLIADMKILPVNKRGVKLFLPFSNRSF